MVEHEFSAIHEITGRIHYQCVNCKKIFKIWEDDLIKYNEFDINKRYLFVLFYFKSEFHIDLSLNLDFGLFRASVRDIKQMLSDNPRKEIYCLDLSHLPSNLHNYNEMVNSSKQYAYEIAKYYLTNFYDLKKWNSECNYD